MEHDEFDNHVQNQMSTDVPAVIGMERLTLESGTTSQSTATTTANTSHPFMDTLLSPLPANRMFTENGGVAYSSTTDPRLDLFVELEKCISVPRLQLLLNRSWAVDPDMTLKIIWNARSIHLGKGEKKCFYRCLGWLRDNHKVTLLKNLKWLEKAVIEKTKATGDNEEIVVVEKDLGGDAEWIVKNGVAHGYWKDLLNIVVLDVTGNLKIDGNMDILNTDTKQERKPDNKLARRKAFRKQLNKKHRPGDDLPEGYEFYQYSANVSSRRTFTGFRGCKGRTPSRPISVRPPKRAADEVKKAIAKAEEQSKKASAEAREHRHEVSAVCHKNFSEKYNNDKVFHILHVLVARLFAEQLRMDMMLLNSGTKEDISQISLAAKWAPSLRGFHDRHTFIATSIAEMLFPRSYFGDNEDIGTDRDRYLRYAREEYRRLYLSPLRKALEVVERDITAETFSKINYSKVPSMAMNNYKNLFLKKDLEHFEQYTIDVTEGKSTISGAVLLPSNLVCQARKALYHSTGQAAPTTKEPPSAADKQMRKRLAELEHMTLNLQWKALVQRIKDSGTLENSIAVCDLSASMRYPKFKDGTTPMDTSIALSLLLAQVTAPPFGDAFITFSDEPSIVQIGGESDTRNFVQLVQAVEESQWSFSTNFVAVFEDLILPRAIAHKLPQEQMVKQVFVFSDMQFNKAGSPGWETAYERIKRKFAAAGYKLPKLVFWNLAGGRAGITGVGDPVAPKPVGKAEEGTALVSGYSQGMLKMFLDKGVFEDVDEDDEFVEDENNEDGFNMVEKVKMDPLRTLKKAVSHRAYQMLKVFD
jgi:hypothetical protein